MPVFVMNIVEIIILQNHGDIYIMYFNFRIYIHLYLPFAQVGIGFFLGGCYALYPEASAQLQTSPRASLYPKCSNNSIV